MRSPAGRTAENRLHWIAECGSEHEARSLALRDPGLDIVPECRRLPRPGPISWDRGLQQTRACWGTSGEESEAISNCMAAPLWLVSWATNGDCHQKPVT
jgi:hypothetical protein